MDRRTFLPASFAGLLAAAAVPRKLFAAEMSDAERANVKVVTDMIAAFDAAAASVPPAADSLHPFFTDDCAFRFRPTDLTATRSFGALEETIKRVTANGEKVQQELLERFAKGPVVVIEKLNHFVTPEKTRTSHVVAICLVKDGKIAEWTEYFISVAVQ
jgi:ketosteroid isomerase-like protein